MSRNINYATGNLLDYFYHQNYYIIIGIDLLKKYKYSSIFTEELAEQDGATMFIFITEKQEKALLNFSLDSLIATEQYK